MELKREVKINAGADLNQLGEAIQSMVVFTPQEPESPKPIDDMPDIKIIPRQAKKEPIYLKDSSFAFDLFEFKWNVTLKKYEISGLYYEGMRNLINSKGFYKRQLTNDTHIYVKLVNNIIEEVTPDAINDEVRMYVDGLPKSIKFEYNDEKFSIPHEVLRNTYLKQHHNIINQKWLTNLEKHTTPILKDTEKTAYFVFDNCFVEVTKDGIQTKDVSVLNGFCIWKDQIIKHSFQYKEDRMGDLGEFEKFIHNVCNNDPQRINALCSAIGYLLHNHFDPTKGQVVLLYDEKLTDTKNPQGGTGKGLIVSSIRILRKTAKIDGKNYKSDDKFKFSNVTPSTQLVWIDETNKYFDFKDLFSCTTDGWQVERKFQNKFDISPKDSPKIVICSNTILDNKGSSNKRRQFIIELSDYYSCKIITGTEEPIKDEHGVLFSDEWDKTEWNNFFSLMLDCSQNYLTNGLCNYQRINVELNLLKQQTCDEFMEYVINTPPPLNESFDIRGIFDQFKASYFGEDSQLKQRTFTNWIKKYCSAKNYQFGNSGKSNGVIFYLIRDQGNSLQ